jgi:tryptophan synthase alpha chain
MKINDAVDRIKYEKEIGFMGHIIAGYPDFKSSLDAALGICKAKADFLEIQFPFSDPFADGPTIEEACYKSIENGFTIEKGFSFIREVSGKTDTALLVMTYGNIIFKYGIEKFIVIAKESGASGLIIPDIPVENDEGLNTLCEKHGLVNIILATPGADAERIRYLSGKGKGFLYTVIRRGITGKKTEIGDDVNQWLDLVKKNSSLPIAAGFGVQSREQIDFLKGKADIAIVGSFFVKKIREAYDDKKDIGNEIGKIAEQLIL